MNISDGFHLSVKTLLHSHIHFLTNCREFQSDSPGGAAVCYWHRKAISARTGLGLQKYDSLTTT